jgi:hypothetical protein
MEDKLHLGACCKCHLRYGFLFNNEIILLSHAII